MSDEAGQIKETPEQAEMLRIAVFKAQRTQQKVMPAIRRLGQQITSANEAGSFERTHAGGAAQTDVAAAFGGAQQVARERAADTGTLGSGRSKLDVVQTGADKATAAGMATVAADQAQDDKYVSGLGALTAIGTGKEATALNGMQQSAGLSGQQAAAAAQRSLDRNMGDANLAGQVLGTGLGMWQSGAFAQAPNTVDYRGTTLPNSLRAGGDPNMPWSP